MYVQYQKLSINDSNHIILSCSQVGIPGTTVMFDFEDDLFTGFRINDFINLIKNYFNKNENIIIKNIEDFIDDGNV
jgi:hypothetical protein